MNKKIEIYELEDFDGSLGELREILNLLILQYSQYATIKVESKIFVEPVEISL
jgi:hypothetical protein